MSKGVKFKIKAQGVEEVLRKLGAKGAQEFAKEIDQIVEEHALNIVNSARHNAPIDTSALKNSIDIYEEGELYRVVGSDRPYAQRQEYEHKTKKGYFRKALWNEREPFRKDIQDAIKRLDG
jgi:Bacteriophage HK97-gp10, putative tail-component